MKNLIEEMRVDFLQFLPKHLDPEECWLWQGDINSSNGYGIFYCEDRNFLAHRSAAILFGRKTILPKMDVYHICGNTLCCNPHHLCIRDKITQHTYDCMGVESLFQGLSRG